MTAASPVFRAKLPAPEIPAALRGAPSPAEASQPPPLLGRRAHVADSLQTKRPASGVRASAGPLREGRVLFAHVTRVSREHAWPTIIYFNLTSSGDRGQTFCDA